MMNQLKITLIAVASILFVYSCKSQYDALLNSNDADAKYKAAFEYFNNNKYQKAAALFESLAVLTNGTDRDDTVRYYWGLSNYRYGDFYTAETNFAKFAEIYLNLERNFTFFLSNFYLKIGQNIRDLLLRLLRSAAIGALYDDEFRVCALLQ